MRRHTTTAITACLLLATLTACGSDREPAAKPSKPTASNTWPGGMSPEPDTPTEEEPEPLEPFDLEQSWSWESTGDETATGTTTVIGYTQPIRSIATAAEEVGQSGYVWGALELKVCVDTGSAYVSSVDWVLAYKDGARVEPSSSTYDDFPKPEFPFEADVRAGDCVRGKIVFPVPAADRPERAVFSPQVVELEEPVEWVVPEK